MSLDARTLVRLTVSPPDRSSSAIIDTYVDTGTLNLLYDPPVQMDNRSTFLMLERNELSSSLPLTPDRFSISSYVIPQAGLVVAPRPNGNYYQVDFQITDEPTQLYCQSDSSGRCALYDKRERDDGSVRIYLKPYLLEDSSPPQNRIIRGVELNLESCSSSPFVFRFFKLEPEAKL